MTGPCDTCGALVPRSHEALHDRWHDDILERARQAILEPVAAMKLPHVSELEPLPEPSPPPADLRKTAS